MARDNSSNQIEVPASQATMDEYKKQIANELGINLKNGYNGDLTSRQAGSIGGMMVKRMIAAQEEQMAKSGNMPSPSNSNSGGAGNIGNMGGGNSASVMNAGNMNGNNNMNGSNSGSGSY